MTRPCRGCAAPIARSWLRYCPTCTRTRCGICHGRDGQHWASCARAQPRVCRGCGGPEPATGLYCDACRAQQCPECQGYGGRHGATCRYVLRQRRPPLTTRYRVVTEAHIAQLYTSSWVKAVRIARYVGALTKPEAEDVVSEVFLYLWRNRDLLKVPPGRAYLFKAVTNGALRVRRSAWARHVVALDPETLVLAEQATYDPTSPAIAVPL